ncbi:pyrimidine oxygenase [Enhydrobacter aerosaccus]|uniref:Pyrimidine monooxygenase RutA n=1 Tax=Enhydrobacter aerosaccus TaxID=225324 RepID=A0A1T4NWS1_9HYPH|nr:pyrimidine utilization protein A [Enhydrobacter aerosaccus]SJZ83486.1 pyrimidine oxygenase [Enhydrobacter aerosaccus]
MEIGVFIPIGSNGWLISTTSPQYKPSFELNRQVTLNAERYGLDFVLSMIKLRGFGGKSEFWDHNLESFTLMAGLAAVTSRIKLFATVPTLVVPPAIAARMCATIDSISNGRFGLNVITGWQRPEYSQMGLWPGDQYFGRRYDYAAEYVQVLRDLWTTGVSNFKGEFFTMNDCRLSPRPQADMKVICAGTSDAGMAFTAKHADYNFCFGKGINTPTACSDTVGRMQAAAEKTGRPVAAYALFMVITGETDEEARAKYERYKDGADLEALAWMVEQATADKSSGGDSNVRHAIDPSSMVNLNIGLLVGSHATVASLLDEVATVPGLAGVLLTFDEFVSGTETFGERIQPLMACRQHIPAPASAAA